MKSVAASIVVLSGAIVVVGGAYIQHDDKCAFIVFVGCVIALVGLISFGMQMRQPKDQ